MHQRRENKMKTVSGYTKVRRAIEQEWGHLTDAEIDKLINLLKKIQEI